MDKWLGRGLIVCLIFVLMWGLVGIVYVEFDWVWMYFEVFDFFYFEVDVSVDLVVIYDVVFFEEVVIGIE